MNTYSICFSVPTSNVIRINLKLKLNKDIKDTNLEILQ